MRKLCAVRVHNDSRGLRLLLPPFERRNEMSRLREKTSEFWGMLRLVTGFLISLRPSARLMIYFYTHSAVFNSRHRSGKQVWKIIIQLSVSSFTNR